MGLLRFKLQNTYFACVPSIESLSCDKMTCIHFDHEPWLSNAMTNYCVNGYFCLAENSKEIRKLYYLTDIWRILHTPTHLEAENFRRSLCGLLCFLLSPPFPAPSLPRASPILLLVLPHVIPPAMSPALPPAPFVAIPLAIFPLLFSLLLCPCSSPCSAMPPCSAVCCSASSTGCLQCGLLRGVCPYDRDALLRIAS